MRVVKKKRYLTESLPCDDRNAGGPIQPESDRPTPPEDGRDNLRASVVDDILTVQMDLRCPGQVSSSGQSLLVVNSQGWRPFVGGHGCELLVMVRKRLLAAHPTVIEQLNAEDYDRIHPTS